MKIAKENACALNTHFCSGECIATYTGTKKGDPTFDACIACIVIMRRQGLKVRQVKSETRTTKP